MKFKYIEVVSIPELAWCAQIPADKKIITVIHGPGVETQDDMFYEGAWDGPLTYTGLDKATEFSGTGGRLIDDTVEFMTPTYPYRGLLMTRLSNSVLVSNSLPFLLSRIGDKPSIKQSGYYTRLFFIFNAGFNQERTPLTMANGSKVNLHIYCNIRFGQGKYKKTNPVEPADFSDYRDRLVGMLQRIRENASDPNRKQTYKPLVTLSRGYDSVACAALAREAGWRDSVNLKTEDTEDNNFGDDATLIAEKLGMTIETFDFDAWRDLPDSPEAEFVATAWAAVMVRFAGMKQRLRHSLLVLGSSGDVTWNAESQGINKNWLRKRKGVRASMGAESLWEFQLHTGFIPVYPATYMAMYWRLLHKMMSEEELKSWSVGGNYDRPFARRIAEEAGIPRELFGQQKMGSSHIFPGEDPSPSGNEAYIQFRKDNGLLVMLNEENQPVQQAMKTHHFHWAIGYCMKRYEIPGMEIFT